ncbi:MAG: hypothetical protein CM15mV125_290 [uncultured marine virus]|nr:MAG: hypothetical protein CM15mV125_290 [uncultured marine virus]
MCGVHIIHILPSIGETYEIPPKPAMSPYLLKRLDMDHLHNKKRKDLEHYVLSLPFLVNLLVKDYWQLAIHHQM